MPHPTTAHPPLTPLHFTYSCFSALPPLKPDPIISGYLVCKITRNLTFWSGLVLQLLQFRQLELYKTGFFTIYLVCQIGVNPDENSDARVFKKACSRVGIYGASTHSLRRTALTQMSDAGIPLRIVQEVSGHRNLSQLQKYLEVRPSQVRGALASLAMISPLGNPSPKLTETDGKRKSSYAIAPL
jgi:hypothetical protein